MVYSIMEIMQKPYYGQCLILYIVIIASSTLFAFLSQAQWKNIELTRKSNQKILDGIHHIFLFLSFFILWFFSAFASCGADREAYSIIFQNVSISSIFDGWQEPGFNLFNLIFRIFGDNPRIIYIAMTTITLGLVYSTLSYLKDEIRIGFAVLAYGSLFYVQSLSLMRIYMASAILFWGIRFLKKDEYLKYGIVILVTILIHYSTMIMILPWAILYLMYHHRYQQGVHVMVLACALAGGLVAFKVMAPVMGAVPMFSRFQQYFENTQSGGIGIMQFIYFIPIAALVFVVYPNLNENYKRIFFTFTSGAFFVAIMSYVIIILGRAFVLFSILYLFVVPYALSILKKKLKGWQYMLVCAGVIAYYAFRFMVYISEYHELDQVIPYTNILF